jgi:hypothetical protein
MADNNSGGWKPWKDGFFENLSKIGGWYAFFLIASGLLGAGYSPMWTNPYVWGLQVRVTVLNLFD